MKLAQCKIPYSFGRASKTYDKHAIMQVVAANQLAEMLPNRLGIVCEVGCGTGIMTSRIMERRPEKLIISDIAPAMLNITKHKFPTTTPALIDTQHFPIKQTETIISNMTLQWVDDLPRTVQQLAASSQALYFSVPLAQSMPEWRSFCSQNNIRECLRSLPKFEDVLQAVPTSHNINYKKNSFCLYYDSWLTFWQSQKKLGAHSSHIKSSADYSARGKLSKSPIKITYEICCIAIRRKEKV